MFRIVNGGFGPQPSAKAEVDTTREVPQPRPLKPAEAQALMTAELLHAVRSVAESATALTDTIGRMGATNGVLDVALITLDASGTWTNDYPVVVGSLVIANHSTTQAMTVHTGSPGLSAPQMGRGVQMVAAGAERKMPVAARAITVWGKPGDQFSLQTFTGLQAYGIGAL